MTANTGQVETAESVEHSGSSARAPRTARPGRDEGHAPLLELRGLTRSVRLPSREMLHILRGIDLTVEAGDHVAVVGRSGSGKTTLLNLLGMIDRQTSGELLFDGKDVSRLSDARRARLRGASIGFVFQQFNLLERRTALENVMMPMMYGTARQFWRRERSAMEMLDRVGLADRAHQLPTRLSGGEQQRVAVARALVRRPRLILADEPTGALDAKTTTEVMTLLRELNDQGCTIVVITHEDEVAEYCTRRVWLRGGTIESDELNEHRAGGARPLLRAS